MDEEHLTAAFRSVLRNPVQAGPVRQPEQWRGPSAAACLKARLDGITDTAPMLRRFPDMAALLKDDESGFDELAVAGDETIGRPRGTASFLAAIERRTGRSLTPGKRGPKPRES